MGIRKLTIGLHERIEPLHLVTSGIELTMLAWKGLLNGAGCKIRTRDIFITSEALYQLS